MKIIRLKFRKLEKVKYISHIETMDAFERAFRRAELDVSFTKGFNPGMRMVFALPLPVGVTSDSEYVDIWFDQDYEPEHVLSVIQKHIPSGFEMLEAFNSEKYSLMEAVGSAVYRFWVQSDKNLKECIDQLMSLDEIYMQRGARRKKVDIVPLIYKIDYHDEGSFSVLCKAGANGNLNPRLLLDALNEYTNAGIKELCINRNNLFLKVP